MNTPNIPPQWISGFIDGEGSFQCNITCRERSRYGVEFTLCFSVAQNRKNALIIDQLYQYFQCGYLLNDRKSNCRVFRVRNMDELRRIIIPFFKKYPLLTTKQEDFTTFVQIHTLLTNGEMNNKQGAKKIVTLAYSLNTRGKQRKNTFEKLISIIDKR